MCWRGASANGHDVGIDQLKTIVSTDAERLVGKTGAMQPFHEERARSIPGEHAAGSIATMSSRCQPNYEKPGCRIAKSRQRLAPVSIIAKCGPLFSSDFFTMFNKTRTTATGDDFLVQFVQRFRHHIP
jgi:hypothetical protein